MHFTLERRIRSENKIISCISKVLKSILIMHISLFRVLLAYTSKTINLQFVNKNDSKSCPNLLTKSFFQLLFPSLTTLTRFGR